MTFCSGGTIDQKYCSKFHKCGSYNPLCPKVPNSARDHNECYTSKAGVFSCLNRMDKYPDLFNQNLYEKEPLNLEKLSFEFNNTHLQCQEKKWIPWTGIGFFELGKTKSCQSKKGNEVGGFELYNLFFRDMGFKNRSLIYNISQGGHNLLKE